MDDFDLDTLLKRYTAGYLKEHVSLETVKDVILERYNHPFRYFHNMDHISYILKNIFIKYGPYHLQTKILVLAALFHDICYDPMSTTNEEDSVRIFKDLFEEDEVTNDVCDIIIDTKYRKLRYDHVTDFHKFDFGALYTGDFQAVLRAEDQIMKEYQQIPYPTYLDGRLQFITDFKNEKYFTLDPSTISMLHFYLEYLRNRRLNIGIYAGSFMPFHNGHFNILQKAEKIFDKVILVFAKNPNKNIPFRTVFQSTLIDNREKVVLPEGELLTTYISQVQEYANVTLIRGLRDGYDLAYEINQLRYFEDLYPDIKMINIVCDKDYSHISSTSLRSLYSLGLSIDQYLP